MKLCNLFFLICVFMTTLSMNTYATIEEKEITHAYYKSYQYEKVGDYTNAINSLMLILNDYPTGYTINIRLAHLYLSTNKYANAIKHYNTAHKTVSTAIAPQLGIMRVMNRQLRFQEAEAVGYSILQSDIYNYYANLYLAYALRMDKKWESATSINLKMLNIYPSDTYFLLEYGLLSFSQENYIEAKNALDYVLLLDPENVTAKETLKVISGISK